MIDFKQFENKSDMRYVIIDMERGLIESIQVFNDKESAHNWVRNFIYENFEGNDCLEDIKGVFDPEELLNLFNERWAPDYEMYLYDTPERIDFVKLDRDIELQMTTKKYNI